MSRLGPRRRAWLVWPATAPMAVWALVRSFGLEEGFPLVPLMAYTPYAAVLSIFVAAGALAFRNWLGASLAIFAATMLAAAVVPRAIGGPATAPAGSSRLAVLSANVHHGTAEEDALVALVHRHRPDVLTVQELTPSFASRLAAAGLERALPHRILSVREGASGAGIYSRLPLQRIPEPESFAFRMPRAGVILDDGRTVRLVDVHPYPPQAAMIGSWKSALESLPATGPGNLPWVLSGDFNATLDVAELREVLGRGYRDAAEAMGEGLTPTWPSNAILPPPVTIDHVLADRRIAILDYEVESLPGSDHRAVYARLAVP